MSINCAKTSALVLKGVFSGLRQILVTESPLKMMKNAFFSPQKLWLCRKTAWLER